MRLTVLWCRNLHALLPFAVTIQCSCLFHRQAWVILSLGHLTNMDCTQKAMHVHFKHNTWKWEDIYWGILVARKVVICQKWMNSTAEDNAVSGVSCPSSLSSLLDSHLVKADTSLASQHEPPAWRLQANKLNRVNTHFKTNTRCCEDFAMVPCFEL